MATRDQIRVPTPRQQRGRVVNAIAELLRKRLSVPNIYIEPRSSSIAADLLAVDRAGAGDLHGVKIHLQFGFETNPLPPAEDPRRGWMLRIRKGKIKEAQGDVVSLPVHYKYWALPRKTWNLILQEFDPVLYSPDGIGRIGVIGIDDHGEDPPVVEVLVTPERFRVDPGKLHNIETKLLAEVRPDIEVRI